MNKTELVVIIWRERYNINQKTKIAEKIASVSTKMLSRKKLIDLYWGLSKQLQAHKQLDHLYSTVDFLLDCLGITDNPMLYF